AQPRAGVVDALELGKERGEARIGGAADLLARRVEERREGLVNRVHVAAAIVAKARHCRRGILAPVAETARQVQLARAGRDHVRLTLVDELNFVLDLAQETVRRRE